MTKTHLISGAASGIGRCIYDLLLKKGDTVHAIVHTKGAKRKLSAKHAIICDCSNLKEVVEQFSGFKSKLDSFIWCAGMTHSKTVFEMTADELSESFNVNVIAPMIILKHIRPHLKKGATVVLFSSQSAFKGSYDDAYAASKSAVHGFVKSVAAKLAPDVRVVCLAPGITYPTRLTSEMSPDLLAKKKREIPLHRFAQPRDIARIVEFVLSDACDFMTGCTIDVNGGLVLR